VKRLSHFLSWSTQIFLLLDDTVKCSLVVIPSNYVRPCYSYAVQFSFWIYINSMLQSCTSADEVTKLTTEGQALLQLIEDSPKPVVAAIMGSCLGGGLEVCPNYVLKFVLSASHNVGVLYYFLYNFLYISL